MRLFRGLAVALLAVACDDGTGPAPGLEGIWDLVQYVDAGVVGVTTGTMSFRGDGSFVTEGTVTYPGEPEDSLTTRGTWSQHESTVSFTVEGETSDWQISGSSLRVTLRLIGQTPVTRIVLERLAL